MKHFLLKPAVFFVLLLLSGLTAPAQDFVWKKGGNQVNLAGVYGTQGTVAAANTPGGRGFCMSWQDNAGNFWLFGGYGYDLLGNYNLLNDLWKFDPMGSQWTWMSGSNNVSQFGTYGTQGTAAAGNVPGARRDGCSWVDNNGNLWLCGGYGYDASGSLGELNDLWQYNVTTGQWTWMKGSSACYQIGTYGTQGTGANGNVPGARYSALSWTDASGNFWLFGGLGFPNSNFNGILNDLWRYEPATNQWTWMKGSNTANQYGTYGTQGTAAAANVPGSRSSGAGWTDALGNLWLIGGNGYASSGPADILNDLWKYNVLTNQWTWIKGNNTTTSPLGIYGSQGSPAPANLPGGRYNPITWRDVSGDLWLFSGYGYGSGNTPDALNDLWRYDIGGNQWTWVKGSNTTDQLGAYGVQNFPSALNMPGARLGSASWKDGSNNLWLFGGTGYDGSGIGRLNDVWKFFNCSGPNITISSSSNTVCAGIQATLTAGGANTYTWTGLQTTSTLAIAPLGTSSYTVFGTDVFECSDTVSYTLTVLDLPTLTTSATSSLICAGETTSLMSSGAVSYTWSTTDVGSTVAITPTATTLYTVVGADANGCMNSASISQSVSACLGIFEQEALNRVVSIYPNPSHGAFTIKLNHYEAAELVIFNALGQKVYEQSLGAEESLVKPGLANGLYQYQLMRSAQVVASGKLVVE